MVYFAVCIYLLLVLNVNMRVCHLFASTSTPQFLPGSRLPRMVLGSHTLTPGLPLVCALRALRSRVVPYLGCNNGLLLRLRTHRGFMPLTFNCRFAACFSRFARITGSTALQFRWVCHATMQVRFTVPFGRPTADTALWRRQSTLRLLPAPCPNTRFPRVYAGSYFRFLPGAPGLV